MRMYVLDAQGNPVAEGDLEKWGTWFASAYRRVALTHVSNEVDVSTVFLGMDHNFFEAGEPVLWETMIFGGVHDGFQQRYTSLADAQQGHIEAVALAKEGLEEDERAEQL